MQGNFLGIKGSLVLSLLLAICSVSSFGQGSPDTLVLKDGSRTPIVTYKIDKFYKVLRYRSASDIKDKIASFTNIEALIGSDGVNHAPELLEGWYKPSTTPPVQEKTPDTTAKNASPPPQHIADTLAAPVPKTEPQAPTTSTWHAANDPLYKKAHMRFWNVGLRCAGNFGIPAGEWYTDVNSGIGFEGDFFISLTQDLAIRFSISRAGLSVSDNFVPVYVVGNASLVSQSSYMHATRYFLSAMYYHRIHPLQDKSPIWHAWTGLGAINHKLGASATIRDNDTGDLYTAEASTSSSKFAMTLGGGIIAMLHKNYGIDFSAGMDIVYVSAGDGSGGVTYGYIFDLKVGFIALF